MKDERFWMRFPIAFDEDPTIAPLSDAAFRAFVEMNGYSRRNDLDGRIPARAAAARWSVPVLEEIMDARPESPILILDGDAYVLTKYDRHQMTTGERDALSAKRSAAGRQGAAKTNGKKSASAAASAAPIGAASAAANGRQTVGNTSAESESESEIDLTSDVTYEPLSGTEVDARAKNADGDVIARLRERALIEADRLRITDLEDVRDWLEKASGLALTLGEAVELAGDIIGRAKSPVDSGDKYVIGTCRKAPARVAQYADALDLGHDGRVVA